MPSEPGPDVDYRFTLANERTFLAWTRTSLALLAGGVAAAKALDFQHELVRWLVAAPPLVAGTVLAAASVRRWRTVETTMRQGGRLPVDRDVRLLGFGIAAYGVLVLVACALDA